MRKKSKKIETNDIVKYIKDELDYLDGFAVIDKNKKVQTISSEIAMPNKEMLIEKLEREGVFLVEERAETLAFSKYKDVVIK